MTDENDNSDVNGNGALDPKKEEEPKAIKIAKELQKQQRESEQLDADPEQVLEEQETRQPQSRRINNVRTIVPSLALS